MTRQISSSLTFIFRLFIPAFWLSFFGAAAAASLFSDKLAIPGYSALATRFALWALLGSTFFIFWKTFWRLHRVDADAEYIFITNFFKTARYKWIDVEKIELANSKGLAASTLVLKGAGTFGKNISFLASKNKLKAFLTEQPQLFDYFENL